MKVKKLGELKANLNKNFKDLNNKILEELKETIEDYIYYYNNKRIKKKLKGLTLYWPQKVGQINLTSQ